MMKLRNGPNTLFQDINKINQEESTGTNMSDNGLRIEKYFRIFVIVIIIIFCLPYLRAASLAVFRDDDFSNSAVYYRSGKSILEFSASETVRWYKEMSGHFCDVFLDFATNPLNWYSYKLLRLDLIFLLSAFFVGMYLSIRAVTKFYKIEIHPVYLTFLILIPLLSYRDYHEIYGFYSAAMSYLLPLIGTEFCIVFLIKWEERRKPVYFCLALFFSVLMTACVLEVTGFGMWCFLILILSDYVANRRINKGFTMVFLFALIVSLVNTMAPGNFVRYGMSENNKLQIGEAVLSCFRAMFLELKFYYSNATFLIAGLLAFIIGTKLSINLKNNSNILIYIIVTFFLLPAITVFPVELGYKEFDNDLPNRCMFPFDLAVIMFNTVLLMTAGSIAKKKITAFNISGNVVPIGIALSLILLLAFLSDGPDRSIAIKIAENAVDGDMIKASYYQKQMYEQIRTSEEQDVTVSYNVEHKPGNTELKISEDPHALENHKIAVYFGKNSVRCIPEGTE